MTYLELFAHCLSVATKSPVEEIMAKFMEFAEYIEPHAMLRQEAPEKVINDLIAMAESDPEGVIQWAVKGIPGAVNTITKMAKH